MLYWLHKNFASVWSAAPRNCYEWRWITNTEEESLTSPKARLFFCFSANVKESKIQKTSRFYSETWTSSQLANLHFSVFPDIWCYWEEAEPPLQVTTKLIICCDFWHSIDISIVVMHMWVSSNLSGCLLLQQVGSSSVYVWRVLVVISIGNYESVISPACCDNPSHRRRWRDESRRCHKLFCIVSCFRGCKNTFEMEDFHLCWLPDITAERWQFLRLHVTLRWYDYSGMNCKRKRKWSSVEQNQSYRGLEPEDRWGLGCYSALSPSGLDRRNKAEAYGGRCKFDTASKLLIGWYQHHRCACGEEGF